MINAANVMDSQIKHNADCPGNFVFYDDEKMTPSKHISVVTTYPGPGFDCVVDPCWRLASFLDLPVELVSATSLPGTIKYLPLLSAEPL